MTQELRDERKALDARLDQHFQTLNTLEQQQASLVKHNEKEAGEKQVWTKKFIHRSFESMEEREEYDVKLK